MRGGERTIITPRIFTTSEVANFQYAAEDYKIVSQERCTNQPPRGQTSERLHSSFKGLSRSFYGNVLPDLPQIGTGPHQSLNKSLPHTGQTEQSGLGALGEALYGFYLKARTTDSQPVPLVPKHQLRDPRRTEPPGPVATAQDSILEFSDDVQVLGLGKRNFVPPVTGPGSSKYLTEQSFLNQSADQFGFRNAHPMFNQGNYWPRDGQAWPHPFDVRMGFFDPGLATRNSIGGYDQMTHLQELHNTQAERWTSIGSTRWLKLGVLSIAQDHLVVKCSKPDEIHPEADEIGFGDKSTVTIFLRDEIPQKLRHLGLEGLRSLRQKHGQSHPSQVVTELTAKHFGLLLEHENSSSFAELSPTPAHAKSQMSIYSFELFLRPQPSLEVKQEEGISAGERKLQRSQFASGRVRNQRHSNTYTNTVRAKNWKFARTAMYEAVIFGIENWVSRV